MFEVTFQIADDSLDKDATRYQVTKWLESNCPGYHMVEWTEDFKWVSGLVAFKKKNHATLFRLTWHGVEAEALPPLYCDFTMPGGMRRQDKNLLLVEDWLARHTLSGRQCGMGQYQDYMSVTCVFFDPAERLLCCEHWGGHAR